MYLLKVVFITILSFTLMSCVAYDPKPLDSLELCEALNNPNYSTDAVNDCHEGFVQSNDTQCREKCDLNHVLNTPLNEKELRTLAVLLNPDLKALRAKEKVASAQVFAAGLLPDPQFAWTYGHVLGMIPGAIDAYNYGLNWDIGAAVTAYIKTKIAKNEAEQTHFDVAWQEWLTANKAQLLAIKRYYLEEQLKVAQKASASAKKLVILTRKELENHDTTIDVFGLRQATYLDFVDKAITLDRSLKKIILELNALLGLPPERCLKLRIRENLKIKCLNSEAVFAAAECSRLDLLALRVGYESQEAKVLQSILGQFPHFSLGFNKERDDTDIHLNNYSLSFDIPIFNRNRGKIAIAKTTREQLYLEYFARLNTTRSDIAATIADLRLVLKEEAILNKEMPKMREAERLMRNGLETGNVTLITYQSFLVDYVTNELKLLALKQNKAELWIALQIAQGREIGC